MKREPWLRWRKDETAVSPVIAVILMVAITVVLAAVVYTWASGLAGTSGQGISQGACSQGSGNFLTISEAPGTSIARSSPTYRMVDTDGNTWDGVDHTNGNYASHNITGEHFDYEWSGTWHANIEPGDVMRVPNNASATNTNDAIWDDNEQLTFQLLFQGETVLNCPFRWDE